MSPRECFQAAGRAANVVGPLLAAFWMLIVATTMADAAQVIPGNGTSVRIEVNRGSLIRLDRPAATVFVADPEIADIQVKSPSLVYVLGKKPGQTTLYAVDAGERVLANVEITVTHNLSRLNSAVRALYPDANVNISSVEDAVIIDGVVGNATASENVRRLAKTFIGKEGDIINRLGVTAPVQVNLRVRVAEINRNIEKQLGFNWSFLTHIAGQGFLFSTLNPFGVNAITDRLGLDFGIGKTDFNVIIDALENEGLISVEKQNNLSPQMATVLKIAGRCRLNVLISGGTGSGKTTLLNAMSRMIDNGERIVTIEDAAELQLQQPHVVRLETRPPNLEGQGEITQRDLVKNALRMRPDRIILGEIRSGEALEMLQAMNTGHDGSMCTIHANRPREALTRLENMVAMTGVKLPHEAVRAQIAGAVNLIVQVARMRDGVRRITHITEVVGMEGKVITTQDLFTFEFQGEDSSGRLYGTFKCSGLRPHFTPRAEYYGLDRALLEAAAGSPEGGR